MRAKDLDVLTGDQVEELVKHLKSVLAKRVRTYLPA